MNKTFYTILAVGVVVALITIFDPFTKKKEGFGGPIKNIRKIPLSECRGLCMQNYNRCMADRAYIDANWCATRYQSCLNQCQYSDFHRL